MSWIKRNLYFVIGSVIALALMGLAGWYLYSNWQLNNEILEKLNADYEQLRKYNAQNPHPGVGSVERRDRRGVVDRAARASQRCGTACCGAERTQQRDPARHSRAGVRAEARQKGCSY